MVYNMTTKTNIDLHILEDRSIIPYRENKESLVVAL